MLKEVTPLKGAAVETDGGDIDEDQDNEAFIEVVETNNRRRCIYVPNISDIQETEFGCTLGAVGLGRLKLKDGYTEMIKLVEKFFYVARPDRRPQDNFQKR